MCLAFRLISVLFFPSPQFLPFSFTAQAERAVTTVTWYYQNPEARLQSSSQGLSALNFLANELLS